ncbi:hypothetical protein DSECCO2_548800 [anaerobic digester metagenome]
MAGAVNKETLYPIGFFYDITGYVFISNLITADFRVEIDAAVQFFQNIIPCTFGKPRHIFKVYGGILVQAGDQCFTGIGSLGYLIGVERYRMMENISFLRYPVDIPFE